MPLVSIIIPVYNVEKYILRCLASIQQQSLKDIEIIIVNDCTPDHSMSVVNELAKDDHRISILNLERNEGPMIARKKGYMAATGDYITFCDGDDYLPPTAIETLYHAAIESNADIISGNIMYINESGERCPWMNRLKYGNSREGIFKSLLRHELGHNLCSKMFKAALLQKKEYRTYKNATNGEDGCMLYQIIANMTSIVQIKDAVYYYVQNAESSSQKKLSKNALENICSANTVRIASVSKYPELQKDLIVCVSTVLVDLYYSGYNKNGTLSKLISKYNLNYYCSNMTIIRSYPFVVSCKLLMKKYMLRKK